MNVTIPGTVLYQLVAGLFEAGPGINELRLLSTEPGGDPALLRVGGTTAAGGGLAGDVFVRAPDADGIRRGEMVVLIQYKKDERTRGRDDVVYGELTVHVRGPATPSNPDGQMLVALVLHDYVWIKGISQTPYPVKPWLDLPPREDPPPPPDGPKGDDFTPEQRTRFVAALETEFGFPPDPQSATRYITQGHSPSFRELHDDMLPRNDGAHNPDVHLAEAPY